MRFRNAWIVLAAGILSGVEVNGTTQSLNLEQGWNLVTIQVLPTDPTPGDGVLTSQDVFGSIAGLRSVWSFDNETKKWSTYRKPVDQNDAAAAEQNALPGVGISSVAFGSSFWIEMATNANVQLQGEVPSTAPAVELHAGWNLIGIPVAGPESFQTLSEQVPLVSALALQGFDYDTVLQWQADAPTAPGYNANKFGTAENNRNEEEFQFLEVNRGYWVNVTEPQTILPSLLTTARGDTDLPPIGNFPNGPEDVSISGDASPVAARDQTKIVFFEDEDVQSLSFSNEGGGLMLWEAEWVPDGEVSEEPWMSLAFEQSEQSSDTALTGVTTVETESIHLRLNRKNLTKGSYTGTLYLRTSAGDKAFEVTANVGGLKGEWKGFAVISSVNGKRNPVPDIDLNLSFYEDGVTSGLLRGAIDASQSALWPVDVQLIGYVTGATGNGFQLGGAFLLPPGDQNQQPFDVWDASATGTDVDWNDDGFNPLDRINPFPFPIYRSVVLEGELVTANPVDDEGYRIEGTYREVVYGMLREPIEMEGRFQIDRVSPTPFDSLQEAVVTSASMGTSPIATGPKPGTIVFGTNATRTRTVTINSDLLLNDVRVSFDLRASGSNSLASTDIQIELEAPSGERLVLHDGSAIDPASLRQASYPGRLTPLGTSPDLATFVATVSDTSGNWDVIFTNNSGQTIIVQDVSVVLVGQPIVDIHGRVTNASGGGLEGADISLTGLPFSQVFSGITDSNGEFVLSGIPAMPVNLSAFLPGHEGGNSIVSSQLIPQFAGPASNDEEARFASRFRAMPAVPVGTLGVPGFDSSGTSSSPFVIELIPEPGPVEIDAFPDYGLAHLEVQFTALRATSAVSWDFGDGNSGFGSSPRHSYSSAGVYTVSMNHAGGTETREIVVLPSPGETPADAEEIGGSSYASAGNYDSFIFQPRFSGGGSLPAGELNPTSVTPEDFPAISPGVELVMVQHAYAANADIDLAPKVSGPNQDFGSDSFASALPGDSVLNNQPGPGNGFSIPLPLEDASLATPAPIHDPGWAYEDHNYLIWPRKWFLDNDGNGFFSTGDEDLAGITAYDSNDSSYELMRGTGGFGGPFTQYRMACNIGSTIMPVGISGASVRSTDADPVTSPALEAGPTHAGLARNLHFQLSTNLLVLPQQNSQP
ncbi:PKD domain-containing protein [Roseibacillus ishigakijimensis]|nr:carboxypeptidase regulatory-like domain-containing protein [Roseibacillus ishigakijimensis]